MHVILAKMSALQRILLCELVSLEEEVDGALNDEGCRGSHVSIRAAVAIAAVAGLHSLAGTEATAARAQQETASDRHMMQHQAGSATPDAAMHAVTYMV